MTTTSDSSFAALAVHEDHEIAQSVRENPSESTKEEIELEPDTGAETDPIPSTHDSSEELTKKPSRNRVLFLIQVSAFFSSWGDRMFSFCVPLVLGLSYPSSLTPTVLYNIFEHFARVTLGAFFGNIIIRIPRIKAVLICLIVQNISVSAAAAVMSIIAVKIPPIDSPTSTTYILFTALYLCAVTSSLASVASKVLVGKDMLVVVSSTDSLLLAKANRTYRALNLSTAVLAPMLIGALCDIIDPSKVMVGVAVWNIISFFLEFFPLLRASRSYPELKLSQQQARKQAGTEQARRRLGPVAAFKTGWKQLRVLPTFAVAVSMVFLYMTVLSPSSSSLAVYLVSLGFPTSLIAGFAAAANLVGLVAIASMPAIVSKRGIAGAAQVGSLVQVTCIVLSLPMFVLVSRQDAGGGASLWVPTCAGLGLVALSRAGLWLFDASGTQILQVSIPEEQRSAVNGLIESLSSLFFLGALALAAILGDPSRFIYLVIVSVCAVVVASVVYSVWNKKKGKNFGEGDAENRT